MDFSPGDFEATTDLIPVRLHFERKAGSRIILWSDGENVVIYEFDLENAELMVSHLQTLLATEV